MLLPIDGRHTAEKVFMNLLTVCFGNEHDREFLALFGESRINAAWSVVGTEQTEVDLWPKMNKAVKVWRDKRAR